MTGTMWVFWFEMLDGKNDEMGGKFSSNFSETNKKSFVD